MHHQRTHRLAEPAPTRRGHRPWLTMLAGLALIACEPRIDTHGFMPNPTLIAEIEPGQQNRQAVESILGTPSAVGTFDDNVWYYITQQTKNFAFFKPEIIDQKVLAVSFDNSGRVADVHRYELEDGILVDPVSRITPTAGKELTIFEQVLGNLGRFGTGE